MKTGLNIVGVIFFLFGIFAAINQFLIMNFTFAALSFIVGLTIMSILFALSEIIDLLEKIIHKENNAHENNN